MQSGHKYTRKSKDQRGLIDVQNIALAKKHMLTKAKISS